MSDVVRLPEVCRHTHQKLQTAAFVAHRSCRLQVPWPLSIAAPEAALAQYQVRTPLCLPSMCNYAIAGLACKHVDRPCLPALIHFTATSNGRLALPSPLNTPDGVPPHL